MSRSEQIAVAARAATTPGQPGDPRIEISGYGRTFDADHSTHLAVRLVYPDDDPTVLRVSREEWWAALALAVRS